MKRAIKPDVPPGEFKCRTCDGMWSSFMENNIPCTMTAIRNGLHDFDFAKPILVQSKQTNIFYFILYHFKAQIYTMFA